MRDIIIYTVFLFLFLSCSSIEDRTPFDNLETWHEPIYRFSKVILRIHDGVYRFTGEFVNVRHPFSVLTNNRRYGVIVKGTTVFFRYPKSAFSLPVSEVKLWAYLKNIEDSSKIKLRKIEGPPLLTYQIPFKKRGEDYVAKISLPQGFYMYWPVNSYYNPAWYHDGHGAQSFFVVKKWIPKMYRNSRTAILHFIQYKHDKTKRPSIDYARKKKGW